MADSHCTGPPLTAGLFLPLLRFRPGLDQPPPGTGDGLRDKDMGIAGVPVDGEAQGCQQTCRAMLRHTMVERGLSMIQGGKGEAATKHQKKDAEEWRRNVPRMGDRGA